MVGDGHELHDVLRGALVVEGGHLLRIAAVDALGGLEQRARALPPALATSGACTLEVLGAHVERAAHKVAPAVGQVGVVDLRHALEADGAVHAVRHVGHEVVAVALDAEEVDDLLGEDGVAAALRHLLALARLGVLDEQEAVRQHVLGHRQAGGHEHRGPDHAVEADDVLAHNVLLSRPEACEALGGLGVAVAGGGDVVDEGVEPHIGHVVGVEGQRDAPVERGARDGEVLEAALDEAHDLVAADLRLDEVGVGGIEVEQRLLELGELEEPALLLDALEGALAVRAQRDGGLVVVAVLVGVGVAHVGLGEVGLLGHAVPALVGALVDVALLLEVLPEVLHRLDVALLGGADEVVVGDLERAPKLLEGRGLGVAPLLGRHVVGSSGVGDLLAVLVDAGEEQRVVAVHATETRLDVGHDGGVGRAQVRGGVHIVDGRGDEVRALTLGLVVGAAAIAHVG